MLNTLEFMKLSVRYRKYRSEISAKPKSREWWKFAYHSINETMIRPRFNQFKWENIKKIIRTLKAYTELYKKRLSGAKMSSFDLNEEEVTSFREIENFISNLTFSFFYFHFRDVRNFLMFSISYWHENRQNSM